MTKTIIISLIELIVILPIVFYTLRGRVENKWRFLFLLVAVFVLNSFLIELPREILFFNLFGGHRNWTGKLFALSGTLIIYLLIKKKYLSQNDFFKIRQTKNSLKPIMITTLLLLLIITIFTRFFGGHSEFTFEALLFQLLPGIEEEMVFRGVILGILLALVKDKWMIGKVNIGNPAIYSTAILFGLVHGLSFTEQWGIDFNFGYCFITFLYGLVWGWMTLKSKSILMPIISHNLLNITITLVTMLNYTANSSLKVSGFMWFW